MTLVTESDTRASCGSHNVYLVLMAPPGFPLARLNLLSAAAAGAVHGASASVLPKVDAVPRTAVYVRNVIRRPLSAIFLRERGLLIARQPSARALSRRFVRIFRLRPGVRDSVPSPGRPRTRTGQGGQRTDGQVSRGRTGSAKTAHRSAGRLRVSGTRARVSGIARGSAQVAGGQPGGRLRQGDEAQLRGAGQQAMPGHDPERVPERPGTAQFSLAHEARHAVLWPILDGQRTHRRVDDLVRVSYPAIDDLDAHVVGREPAQGHRGPHHQAATGTLVAVLALDVLDADSAPGPGDPALPGGQ